MAKNWRELTAVEIDALEGPELSYLVARAGGYEVELLEFPARSWRPATKVAWLVDRGDDWTDTDSWYCPHANANQALEVWGKLGALFRLEMECDDVVVRKWGFMTGPSWYAGGGFCTAICRAYLKARLEAGDD